MHSLAISEEQMRAEWNGADSGHVGRVLEQADVHYKMAERWVKEYSRSRRFVPEGGVRGPASPQVPYAEDAFNGRFGTRLADSIGIVRGERPESLHRSVLHELHYPGGMHLADIFLQDHILAVVEGERTVADADCYSVLIRNREAFSETGAYVGTWGRYAIAPRYGFVAAEVLSGRMEQGKEWTRRTYRFSEFTQGGDGLWTPRRRDVWVEARGSGAPGTHSVVLIKDVSVNIPFADSDFTVDFPPGTKVQDWRSGVGFQLPVDDEVTEQSLRELLRRGDAVLQPPSSPDHAGAVPSGSPSGRVSTGSTPDEPARVRPAVHQAAASHEMGDSQPRGGPGNDSPRVGGQTGALVLAAAVAGIVAGLAGAAVFISAKRRRKEG